MGFAEATRRAEARVEYHLRKKKEQVLLVTSVMENEGKSTVAANLALALAEKHRKVLLIDGDLLKPAMHKLFEEQKGDAVSLAEALEGKTEGKTQSSAASMRNISSGSFSSIVRRRIRRLYWTE